MYFRSGNLSGILIFWKSWMHFSSSSSTVIFSFVCRFLPLLLVSRELAVSVRIKSLLRRCSDCWSIATGPFFRGRSRVWTLVWCDWRLTGPQMTVPCGDPASDWLSELEVESSLKEVPLSPSPSPLWFLQQQSHGGEDQRDGPPGQRQKEREREILMQRYFSFPVISEKKMRQKHGQRHKLVNENVWTRYRHRQKSTLDSWLWSRTKTRHRRQMALLPD